MADCNRLKCQDIPFLIDGVVKIVKSVNKQTTCNDVINKLPSLQCPLAVFESVNGIEKELAGNTKLLKAWRSHGPSDRVVFVVKKSEITVLKNSRSVLLAEIKAQRSNSKRMAKESLKKVSDLAFYVRYQKSKVQNIKRKFDEMDNTGEDRAKKIMKHNTSSSSMDSMDAFLAQTDLEKMSRFLSFCGGVTEEHLGLRKSPISARDQEVIVPVLETREEVKQVRKNILKTGITNIKLGFKKRFLPKKTAKRTTSSGTISSTDSGYKSVTSQCQGYQELAKQYTFIDSDPSGVPRHSTPMIARSFGMVGCDTKDNEPFDLSFYDEIEGKDAILKKFMADQEYMAKEIDSMVSIGYYGFLPEIKDHDRTNRFSLPAFRSQKEKCRYLWDKNFDSDSDTSSVANDSEDWNASQLDNAFMDTPRNRTLRRESGMSNLNRFSLQVMPIDIEDDYNNFNYSFDCTFPRMDESHSVDFSGCFGEGFSHVNDNVGDASFDDDSEDNVTRELLKDICDDSVVESDEGLGSMQSVIMRDIMSMYI